MFATTNTTTHIINPYDTAINAVIDYYDAAAFKKAWDSVSKTYNVYGGSPNISRKRTEK